MVKNIVVALLVVVLAVSFSSFAAAQETMQKKDVKKEEMQKMDMAKEGMGEMKVGTCSPECGFMVRSHNEGEVVEMLKTHAKKQHNMDMSDKDAMARVKPAGDMKHGTMKEEKKMEMKKEEMKKEEMKK